MRTLGIVSLAVVAALSGLAGAASLIWYVGEVVIGQAGEPDRSMLIWGLPVVFLGIGALGLCVGAAVVARHLLRR